MVFDHRKLDFLKYIFCFHFKVIMFFFFVISSNFAVFIFIILFFFKYVCSFKSQYLVNLGIVYLSTST